MEPFPAGVGVGVGVPAGPWKDGVSSLGVGSDRQKREAFFFQHGGVASERQPQWEETLILIETAGSNRTGRFVRFTGWTTGSSGPTPI